MEENKTKPILHFKFDPYVYTSEDLRSYHDGLSKFLSNDYQIVFTPFDISNPTNDATLFMFEGAEYTYEQILSMIKEKSCEQSDIKVE